MTWHYRNADPEYGLWQSRELQTHLEQAIIPKHAIEILTGKANLEVRPRDINKGEIVGRLVKEMGDDLDFVFCAGDDKTDEGIPPLILVDVNVRYVSTIAQGKCNSTGCVVPDDGGGSE